MFVLLAERAPVRYNWRLKALSPVSGSDCLLLAPAFAFAFRALMDRIRNAEKRVEPEIINVFIDGKGFYDL